MEQVREKAVDDFISAMEQLLTALQDLFPSCTHTQQNFEEFQKISRSNAGKKMILEHWHKEVGPYYQACDTRNVERVLAADIKPIRSLRIAEKWRDPIFDDVCKERLIDYVDELNAQARNFHSCALYDYLPQNTATKVQTMAQDIAKQLAEGKATLADIDAIGLGKNLGEEMSDEEKIQFMQNIPQIFQSLQQFSGSDLQQAQRAVPGLGAMLKIMQQSSQ